MAEYEVVLRFKNWDAESPLDAADSVAEMLASEDSDPHLAFYEVIDKYGVTHEVSPGYIEQIQED